jgi:hypothetical protein
MIEIDRERWGRPHRLAKEMSINNPDSEEITIPQALSTTPLAFKEDSDEYKTLLL